jgi:hypothetical protein
MLRALVKRRRSPDRCLVLVSAGSTMNVDGQAHAGMFPDFELRAVGQAKENLNPLFSPLGHAFSLWERLEPDGH